MLIKIYKRSYDRGERVDRVYMHVIGKCVPANGRASVVVVV